MTDISDLIARVQTGSTGRIVIVQPACEPGPFFAKFFGPMAFLAYARWDAFGLGFQVFTNGFALLIGPFMFGLFRALAAKEAG